jgi:hypothetical protein
MCLDLATRGLFEIENVQRFGRVGDDVDWRRDSFVNRLRKAGLLEVRGYSAQRCDVRTAG